MFNKVTAVVLFVKDFQTMLSFYRDTLELPVVQLEEKFVAFKMAGQDFALQELQQSADMVNLPASDFADRNGGVDSLMLCTRVDDVDSVYEKLKAKGVECTAEPETKFWGLRVIYFKDPEGNLWEIAQPIETSEE